MYDVMWCNSYVIIGRWTCVVIQLVYDIVCRCVKNFVKRDLFSADICCTVGICYIIIATFYSDQTVKFAVSVATLMSTQRGKARPTIFISFQVHLNTINKLILPYTVKSKEGVAHQIWCAIPVADSPPYMIWSTHKRKLCLALQVWYDLPPHI